MRARSAIITVSLTAVASVAASVAYDFYVKPWLAARVGNSNGGQ